jgi:excisionase family DNA binding protein
MTKRTTPAVALDIRQRYTIDEACCYLRVSRATIYHAIAAGTLPTIKDGRRTFVPGQAIADRSMLAGGPNDAGAA